jgi:heptosyltransferase-2
MRAKPDAPADGRTAFDVRGGTSTPARIVVLAPNWLGDIVMSLPAIADVRRRWPAAHLAVATRASFVSLFSAVPGVNAVVPLSGGGVRALARVSDDTQRLRDGEYDTALLMPNSFRAAWIAARAGIPQRWGFARDFRARLLTRAIEPPRLKGLHQAEYYQYLTRALDVPAGPLQPELRPPTDAASNAMALLARHGWKGERLVGLAPGAAYGWAKRWPPMYVGVLASFLVRDLDTRPVIVGAASDRQTAQDVCAELRRRLGGSGEEAAINLVGQTDLLTLTGVLSQCSAFVANDSGAMHLAAALGVPVTAIFGPTREWATAPLSVAGGAEPAIVKTDVWCRPCMLRNCPIDHRCMTRISPETVLASVARHLSASAPRPA